MYTYTHRYIHTYMYMYMHTYSVHMLIHVVNVYKIYISVLSTEPLLSCLSPSVSFLGALLGIG